ncbi:MAG: hypothetical protein KC593_12245 [Myxococcales bacterium]|nr:hypothetical protein [Myxococcales bacterium]MCB9628798.1 hypothetical protein [Sandaracinaceae bacterium]
MSTEGPLARVLAHFGLPTLAEQLPDEFRARFGLAPAAQYGIACRDVPSACAAAEALGAGPFLMGSVAAVGWHEAGVPRPRCQLEVGLGYAGSTQVEFLGPGRGTDFYSASLAGAEARLHHAGIYQRGVERLGAGLVAAGHREAVRGGLTLGGCLSFDYRYYDTRAELGIYIEILDFRALARPLDLEPLVRGGAALVRWGRLAASP